ncbi:flagellar protein export ATPase FliI [Piscirickettsia litoralis]|uniref:Flagellum-specific ATP synthase n=1 Tax=Piscirickettsia litoralis TaxID=1891921 RepID=A0ABX3A2M2_9GAMM|nr:flagellar protein export ATPase FliI [Piscirickettsia litoralis]ODN42693.1 flagellar protein export ATPase FliI [Piscirickettsia litoralis]
MKTLSDLISDKLQAHQDIIQAPKVKVEGHLTRMVGLTLEAEGCQAMMGERCLIYDEHCCLEAEVVGFEGNSIYLMPISNMQGISVGARVTPLGTVAEVGVGENLLGRVIDGEGRPLDDKSAPLLKEKRALTGEPINPLSRQAVEKVLDVGVRAVNALLTIGKGQRIGLLAGSGVGKSVLLGMMARFCAANIVVIGLIGERGREVKEFIEDNLGEEGLKHSVVVVAPADHPPLARLHGAMRATAIAEYFREQGKDVLLLMDSLSRFAQAQREIALAVGEPPATKGYPPSVFSRLPMLVERAGNDGGSGSMTAFYTVLAEGDDQQDPIVDAARAVLDGHFVLSRQLADEGHYPAIDIEASISRIMPMIVSLEHQELARSLKQLYAHYMQNKDFIQMGVYQAGSDALLDKVIALLPAIKQFLTQAMTEEAHFDQALADLNQLLNTQTSTRASE